MTLRTWKQLDSGTYGDEAVRFGGDWYALMSGYDESPVIGSAALCLKYYRQDFNKDGASETHLLVSNKGLALID